MKLAHRLALVAAAFAAAPALAQDTPPGPGADKGPAPPAAPDAPKDGAVPPKAAEPAKKERKVDPKGVEAMDKYTSLLHTPASLGFKSLEGTGQVALPMIPDPVTFKMSWSPAKSLSVTDLKLPEALVAQFGGEEAIKPMVDMSLVMLTMLVRPVFGSIGDSMDAYDVSFKANEGGGCVVTMTPYSSAAAYDSLRYQIGADGLVTAMAFSVRIPADNPAAAQLTGVEFESKFTYEKKGERNIVKSVQMSDPMQGDSTVGFKYFELKDGFLAKELHVQSIQGEQSIEIFDYKADGKAVEGTAKAAEKKAEEPKKEPTPAAPTGPEAPKDGSTPAGPGK